MAESAFIKLIVTLAMVVNVASVCSDEYPIDYNRLKINEFGNLIFVGVMLFEFVISFLGYGRRYFKDPYRIMDFVILILGGTEVLYILLAPKIVEDRFLFAIRSIRIIRIMKAATKL
jgi:hypothetical protein